MLDKPRSIDLSKVKRYLWFERIMVFLAIINLFLVIFDLSYIPWRNFYLRNFPTITHIYDPIKGIQPHRDTTTYIETVTKLKKQVVQTGINSPEAKILLAEMRKRSQELIDQNPFVAIGKSGTMEKIKNRIRDRVPNVDKSAKESFDKFWSQEYLTQQDFNKEIAWFDQKILRLIATNYYRGIDEDGEEIDIFAVIDFPFVVIFSLEFFVRTFVISRRWQSVTWFNAMIWRWYDIFLMIPYFRFLRIIPITIRINEAEILNLEPIKSQFSRIFVASFGRELTEMVVIQLLNQVQKEVRTGTMIKEFMQSTNRTYIDINNINELEAIAAHLIRVTICQVLPKLQPDLEALMLINIQNTLKLSPAYQTLQSVPGIGQLPQQIAERLIAEISKILTEGPQNAYHTVNTLSQDPMTIKLANKLVKNFSNTMMTELRKDNSLQEIQLLLSDLIEEIKINYVQQLSLEDFNKLVAETNLLEMEKKL